MSDLVASRSPYLDGAFVSGDAGSFTVLDPATEEPAAEVEASSVAQVDTAIAAARRAFDDGSWPRLTAEERAAVMYRFADALAARKDVLLESVITEAGAARGSRRWCRSASASRARATWSTSRARCPIGSTTRCHCVSTWPATT